jgi:hypothetical protein
MFKNEQYGNSSGSYNVKDTTTGLKRNAMAAAFWSMQPGPKMLWQFGELGYDYSINTCTDGSINNNCRTDPKPIRWDYYHNANRQALYNVYSELLRLRTTPNFLSTFTTGTINYDLSGSIKWESVSSDSLKIIVMGNFDVVAKTGTVTFPSTGTWYSYLTDSITNVGSTSVNITLQPGEFYVFTNRNLRSIALPVTWLDFTAQKTDKHAVDLKWSTATEINNDHFEIQRSTDGTSFSTIGSVLASNKRAYLFTDIKPLSTNYYRIKQIDKDGKYSYSSIIKITFDNNNILLQVYPNPAHNTTSVYAQKELSEVEIILADISGKIIYHNYYNSIEVGQHVDVPVQHLVTGVYVLKVISDQGIKTEKLVVK